MVPMIQAGARRGRPLPSSRPRRLESESLPFKVRKDLHSVKWGLLH